MQKSASQLLVDTKLLAVERRPKKGHPFFQANTELAVLRSKDTIKEWLKHYKKKTQSKYSSCFNLFMRTTGLSISEIGRLSSKELKSRTKELTGELLSTGHAYAAKDMMKAMKSWSDYVQKPFTLSFSEKIRVAKIKTEYIPKPAEIHLLAQTARSNSNPHSPRNSAIILTDWTTALRMNALQDIRIGAVEGYSEGDCPIPIRVGNDKQAIGVGNLWCRDAKISSYGLDYTYTFLHKIAFLEIQEWLAWRRANIGPYEKTDYIFCQLQDKFGTVKPGDRLGHHSIWGMYKTTLELTRLDRRTTSLHQLRDAFKSVMIRADVEEDCREAMMAHKDRTSGANYFDKNDIEMARDQYMKGDFSIDGKSRVKQLEQKVEVLQMSNAAISAMQSRIEDMAREMMELRRSVAVTQAPKTV